MKKVTMLKIKSENEFNIDDMIKEEDISNFEFSGLSSMDLRKIGFVKNKTSFTFVDKIQLDKNNYTLMTVREQKKIPEKYLIETLVNAKKTLYFSETGKTAAKTTIKEWTEEARNEILVQTLPKKPKDMMIAIRDDGLVLVEESSSKTVEDVVACVRKAVGTFPVDPLETNKDVSEVLGQMVAKNLSDVFTLGNEVSLLDEESLKHNLSNGSVYDSDADKYVKDGMLVTKLGLQYDGAVNFVINDNLCLDKIRFDKEFLDAEDSEAGNLLLKLSELNNVINELLSRFNSDN